MKTPHLPERYIIGSDISGVSIDRLVSSILARSLESPILESGSPAGLLAKFNTALPEKSVPLDTVLTELESTLVDYCRKNAHPGCWAYITSSGLPTDPLAHAVTAALNQNVTGLHSAPGASIVEKIVIDWWVQLAGMPEGAGGLLQGGGSLANLSALAVARTRALGAESEKQGLHTGPRPVLLVAETVHFSIIRAARLLGLGTDNIIYIKVNDAQQMCMSSLATALETLNRSADVRIIAVVATAGTTAYGAVDPLQEIAALCNRYSVWLHVDAAYGGAVLLSDALRARLNGIGQANSITIDLHKWCYMSVDCSVLLYRNPELARETFTVQADYVREVTGDATLCENYYEFSPEVSRRFRALAVWIAFRHFGIDTLGRNILHNVECTEYLAACIEHMPELELAGSPQLSVCCFRYVPANSSLSNERLDALNESIVRQLALAGDFLLSSTQINKRSVLRVCIRSHTTRAEHVDRFLESVCRTGRECE